MRKARRYPLKLDTETDKGFIDFISDYQQSLKLMVLLVCQYQRPSVDDLSKDRKPTLARLQVKQVSLERITYSDVITTTLIFGPKSTSRVLKNLIYAVMDIHKDNPSWFDIMAIQHVDKQQEKNRIPQIEGSLAVEEVETSLDPVEENSSHSTESLPIYPVEEVNDEGLSEDDSISADLSEGVSDFYQFS